MRTGGINLNDFFNQGTAASHPDDLPVDGEPETEPEPIPTVQQSGFRIQGNGRTLFYLKNARLFFRFSNEEKLLSVRFFVSYLLNLNRVQRA